MQAPPGIDSTRIARRAGQLLKETTMHRGSRLFLLPWPMLLLVLGHWPAVAADAERQPATLGGLIVRSVKPPKIVPIAEKYLGTVPAPLVDAQAFSIPLERRNNTEAEGLIEIELTRDQPIYVAVSWANDQPGEWSKEAMSRPDFIRAGWTLVGELPMRSSSGKLEHRGLYWRAGKRGQTFRLRTRKAVAPMVIAPRSGAPVPKADNPELAGASMPPPSKPSPRIELTCARPLYPVAADKFCMLQDMPFLAGATIYAYPYRLKEKDPAVGRLVLRVKQDTSLLLAANWDDAKSSEPWAKEVVGIDAMRKAGWTLIGNLGFADQESPKQWLFWRPCRAGEQFVLRTRMAYPPLVLVPRDTKLNPMDSVPSDAMKPGVYRGVLMAKVNYLVTQRRWQELETMVAEFRKTKRRLANGSLLLSAFYDGCGLAGDSEQIEAKQKLLDEWLAARPQSAAAHLALADFSEKCCWDAGDDGFTHMTTAEGGQAFGRYARRSEELARKAGALAEKDPHLYDVLVRLAIDLHYPLEKLKQILTDCAALDPQHTAPYLAASRYFQKGWYGADGALERYAAWAAERTRSQVGDEIYFRIVREAHKFIGNSVFNEYHFDWERIKRGAADDLRLHPVAVAIYAELAEFAYYQGDRAAARDALTKLDGFPDAVIKWERTPQEILRRWVRDDFVQGDQQAVYEVTHCAILSIDRSTIDSNQWIVFDNSGDTLDVDCKTGKRVGKAHYTAVHPRVTTLVDDMALVADWNNEVYAVDVRTGSTRPLGAHRDLSDAMLSGDGRYWVTAAPTGTLRFWDLARDTQPEDCDTKPGLIQTLASLPADQGFITGDRDGKLALWSLYGRKRIRELGKLRSGAKLIRISDDGKLLAAVSRGLLTLWELPEGRQAAQTPISHSINNLVFSPDGKWLAGAAGVWRPVTDASVLLWDAKSGRLVKEFRGHKAIVRDAAFDAESRTLVSGGDDMTLRVWKIPQ
jgi:hypothetical protein